MSKAELNGNGVLTGLLDRMNVAMFIRVSRVADPKEMLS